MILTNQTYTNKDKCQKISEQQSPF